MNTMMNYADIPAIERDEHNLVDEYFLSRQAYVLSRGATHAAQGWKDAFNEACAHPAETAIKVGGSAAVAYAISTSLKAGGLAGKLARGTGILGAGIFAFEALAPVSNAISVASKTNDLKTLDEAGKHMGINLGRLAFDAALSTPGGVAGSVAGLRSYKHLRDTNVRILPEKTDAAKMEAMNTASPGKAKFTFIEVTKKTVSKTDFDMGIELTFPNLPAGKLNLDHHGPGSRHTDPSAAQQALALPKELLPKYGTTIAFNKFDVDSATALAVLSNRQSGRPVDAALVKLIGERDRGYSIAPSAADNVRLDALDQVVSNFRKSRPTTEKSESGRNVQDTVANIQSILDSTLSKERIAHLAEIRTSIKKIGEWRFAKEAIVREVLPKKLTQVTYDSPAGLVLGQRMSPVVVLSNTRANRVTIAGLPEAAESRYLSRAKARLASLEPGWEGRDNIFGNYTKMSPDQISSVLTEFINPGIRSRLRWEFEDNISAIKKFASETPVSNLHLGTIVPVTSLISHRLSDHGM